MEYEVANGLGTRPTRSGNKLKRNSFWAVDTTINVGANGQLFLFWGKASDGTGSAVNTPQPIITPNAVTGSNISRVAGLAKGDNTRRHPLGSQLLVRSVEAHPGLHGLREDQQRLERELQLQHQRVSRQRRRATGGPVGMKLGGFVMGMYHNF